MFKEDRFDRSGEQTYNLYFPSSNIIGDTDISLKDYLSNDKKQLIKELGREMTKVITDQNRMRPI